MSPRLIAFSTPVIALLALLVLTALSGCATVFNSGDKHVSIHSKNMREFSIYDEGREGAHVLVYRGIAPADVQLERGWAREYWVEWDGGKYQLSGDFLNLNYATYFNLPFGVLGLVGGGVDLANGNLWGIRGDVDLDEDGD